MNGFLWRALSRTWDYNMFSRSVDLQFAIFRKGIDMPKMIALPLGEGTLLDAMDRVDQVDMMFAGHQSQYPLYRFTR